MKFTELLVEYLESRDFYNKACDGCDYPMEQLDALEGELVAAERDLNEVVEDLQTRTAWLESSVGALRN